MGVRKYGEHDQVDYVAIKAWRVRVKMFFYSFELNYFIFCLFFKT